MSGLKPDVFREEMYSRSFDTLEDVIREVREDLSTYRDILEISERIKKVEPKKEFPRPRKDFPTAASNSKKGRKYFLRGASPGSFKISGSSSSRVDDLKDVECFKNGHYANKCPESIRPKIEKNP